MRHLLLLLLLSTSALAQQARPNTAPHKATSTAKPKPAATPAAYYCASGNTVKYHASPSCRGLTRCSASVEKLALSDAQARMNPCKICY